MGRRAFTDNKDRFFGAIVYLFALADAVIIGSNLLLLIPALSPLFDLLIFLVNPVLIIYKIIPGGLGGLVVFFVLFIAVVQNQKISYFVRFNTMQSILIGIALSLIQIIVTQFSLPSLIVSIIGGVTFLIVMPVCIYSMVQCALARYPEIPSFSRFAYDQVR